MYSPSWGVIRSQSSLLRVTISAFEEILPSSCLWVLSCFVGSSVVGLLTVCCVLMGRKIFCFGMFGEKISRVEGVTGIKDCENEVNKYIWKIVVRASAWQFCFIVSNGEKRRVCSSVNKNGYSFTRLKYTRRKMKCITQGPMRQSKVQLKCR